MIYALALGTNIDHAAALAQVHSALEQLGACQYSPVYELPDRAGRAHLIYWNQAVLLTAYHLSRADLLLELDQIEQRCGRVRPSQYVRMDIDLIGAGDQIGTLDVVSERLPLPADVLLPMLAIWPACPQTDPLALDIRHTILHADDALRQPFNVE
ncbi:MAG: 2-amino-4-hydroxy-6-hydroxymethyldihydropteridine diphosphokinase [Moraxellaceae bacterium]